MSLSLASKVIWILLFWKSLSYLVRYKSLKNRKYIYLNSTQIVLFRNSEIVLFSIDHKNIAIKSEIFIAVI